MSPPMERGVSFLDRYESARHVAVTLPFASSEASTTARSPLDSTTCARMRIVASIGVGLFSIT